MFIKLTEEQQKNLLSIIADANVKGAQCGIIMDLVAAIKHPVKETEDKNDSKNTN